MSVVEKKLMLFTGTVNVELAESVSKILGIPLGDIRLEKFANGEIYARYNESVRGDSVYLMQSVSGEVNDALMELLIMADAAKRASARSVTAVLTHYGYARQDKKSAAREPITAKLVANLYEAAGIDRIITIDLHQGQIQGFFDIPVNHLTALSLFADYFKAKGFNHDELVVVSPDMGRAKAAKKLADLIDCSIAIMHKGRPQHNVAEITSVIGDVKGKTCIINDDMIDTAGSIIAGVKALKEMGAGDIYVSATHGLLSGPAIERIEGADIKEVVVTDAVPVPQEKRIEKIKVISVAPLFAQAISNVFNDKSVSDLFDPNFALQFFALWFFILWFVPVNMMKKEDTNFSLIVGLGNPGPEYACTRHNAGFLVIDALAQELGVSYWKQTCGSLVAEALYEGRLVVLAKPQSFMNLSGGPMKKLLDSYAFSLSQSVVIHDELDIPAGSARIKMGGGHAGHNGLRSIIDKCQSKDFVRVRVGIGRPPGRMPVSDFVLRSPKGEEQLDFALACDKGLACVKALLHEGLERARNMMNAQN